MLWRIGPVAFPGRGRHELGSSSPGAPRVNRCLLRFGWRPLGGSSMPTCFRSEELLPGPWLSLPRTKTHSRDGMRCAAKILPGRDVPRAGRQGRPRWRSALVGVPAHTLAGKQGERNNRNREPPDTNNLHPGFNLFTATLSLTPPITRRQLQDRVPMVDIPFPGNWKRPPAPLAARE